MVSHSPPLRNTQLHCANERERIQFTRMAEPVDEKAQNEPRKESWTEFLRFAALAAAIVIPIRLFIAQPFVVSGASMVPAFESGHYLIIDEVSYRFEEPKRGEVVVFRFPLEPDKFLIKRIAGLPGETVEIHDESVIIKNRTHPQGFFWQQGEISGGGRRASQSVTLEDDEYFVLGDNRGESADSRLWGALQRHYIIGRPLVRLFPVTQIELFPGTWPPSER